MGKKLIIAFILFMAMVVPTEGRSSNLEANRPLHGCLRGALKDHVEHVLREFDGYIPFSDDSVNFMLFTAIVESRCGEDPRTYKTTQNFGIFQISRMAETEIFRWTKLKHPALYNKLKSIRAGPESLVRDLDYQIIMARVYYYRWVGDFRPLSVGVMASTWKRYYNTPKGRGSIAWAKRQYGEYMNKIKLFSLRGVSPLLSIVDESKEVIYCGNVFQFLNRGYPVKELYIGFCNSCCCGHSSKSGIQITNDSLHKAVII